MPHMQGKKVGVMVYMRPETFRAVEDMRNPYISSSAYCAMLIEEVVSTKV